jgi:hypothetical protein
MIFNKQNMDYAERKEVVFKRAELVFAERN